MVKLAVALAARSTRASLSSRGAKVQELGAASLPGRAVAKAGAMESARATMERSMLLKTQMGDHGNKTRGFIAIFWGEGYGSGVGSTAIYIQALSCTSEQDGSENSWH